MAGSSPGHDWSTILLSHKLSRKVENETQANLLDVSKCVGKTEQSFSPAPEDDFFPVLSIVLADFLIRNASQKHVTISGVISNTCKIILPSLLGSLRKAAEDLQSQNTCPGVIQPNHVLLSLKALCTGTLEMNDTDFELLENHLKDCAMLKDSKDVLVTDSSKKSRPDLNAALLGQFISVIPGVIFEKSAAQLMNEPDPSTSPKRDSATQNLSMVCNQNIANLSSLDVTDEIIRFCNSLPNLAAFAEKWNAVADGLGLGLPSSISEAQSVKQNIANLKEDMLLAKKALSLPLLEPLTKERLRQLTNITLGSLMAALHVATAHSIFTAATPAPAKAAGSATAAVVSKSVYNPSTGLATSNREEEWECGAVTVVETAVEIYQSIAALIQRSPRSGRTLYDNFLYVAAWLLLTGLQGQMTCTSQAGTDKGGTKEDKGKSPSKHKEAARMNLTKIQQGFGGLSVLLASQALSTLEKLLEPNTALEAGEADAPTTAGFDVTESYSHSQRLSRILTDLPLTQLLFHIATVSYRKSCNLKRIQKSGDGETVSLSDSATYYDDDDFSCSEESSAAEEDDDEDSEPILGHWFEETITPPEPKGGDGKGGARGSDDARNASKSCHRNLDISLSVPDKGEPHGYIVLATQVFAFMNDHLLWSPRLKQYTAMSLSEHQLVLLAAIIKDLDRETARTETGTIAAFFGQSIGQLFNRFSYALARYTHNVLASELLSSSLQVALLNHLNINPWSDEVEDWPLLVYPRSLTVLAQVLLSKKDENTRLSCEAACLSIWKRLLDTMIKHIENPHPAGEKEKEAEDLNLEHAQLLLFLFHSLQLMQKKAILLLCAQTLIRAAQAAFSIIPLHDTQLMLLARILLLLEYLIKNLYDAPAAMLEQLQFNLLSSTGLVQSCSGANRSGVDAPQPTRMYNCCRELEDCFRRYGSEEEGCCIRPRFYLLSSVDNNTQDLPKLDGLACSFLLAPSDSFKYSALYGAILNVLHVVHQCEFHSVRKDKRDYNALCAVQYCFSTGWRLVQCLPPSVPVMESLSTAGVDMEPSALLHALLWGPRAAHKIYNAWITDCLVKQGLTTQKAIFVVKAAAKHSNSISFLVKVAKQLGQGMRQSSRLKDIAAVPDLWDVMVMDMVIARLRLLYDECANKDNGDESYRVLDSPTEKLPKTSKISKEIFMELCDLIDSVASLSRRCVLYDALGNSTDTPTLEGSSEAEALQHLLAISSTRGCKLASITPSLSLCLPPFLRAALERWNSSSSDFPAFFCWRSGQSGDLIPSESYLNGILTAHLQLLSSQPVFSPASSLRHLLNASVRLANDLIAWYPNSEEAEKELVGVFFPIALDACFENLVDLVQLVMERLVGSADSERYQDIATYIVISHCHSLVTASGAPIRCLEEKALEESIRFLESCVDSPLTRHPLSRFYTFEDEIHSLWDIVFSTITPELSPTYRKSVFRFINKLLKSSDQNDGDLDSLCLTLLNLDRIDEDRLEAWIEFAILRHLGSQEEEDPHQQSTGSTSSAALKPEVDDEKGNADPDMTGPQDGISLLQNLTNFAVRKGEADGFALALLKLLLRHLSPSSRGNVTPDLVVIMIKLAAVGQGSGHRDLFQATLDWILKYQEILPTESWTALSQEDLTSPPPELASFCCLLQYTTDVLQALKVLSSSEKPAVEPQSGGLLLEQLEGAGSRSPLNADVEDWVDDMGLDDVESDGDESDEDMLCNKLCTYVQTQKEFMNQHWYHCHTCRMVDGVGVCSVCAKVCHRDHDVTYAKFGSFFCDCGAKEDGSCQALVRRPPQPEEEGLRTSGVRSQEAVRSSSGIVAYAPYRMDIDGSEVNWSSPGEDQSEKLRSLAKQLEPFSDEMLQIAASSRVVSSIVDVLGCLLPSIERASKQLSPVGSLQRARRTLQELHHEPKFISASEALMIPTLGSQEGAFENVRMSFTGDQGQTIRQLLSAHVLRRVSMCCLSSTQGRRQHLAMSHEKGKVTVLQLSSLLKQADASKRKLTLTRLSSAPVPFTVLSMASNPANEDVLAVCGLKEVHVMTLTVSGSVQDHLALHPQLETGNFIIKAVWLPGSPTQLAIITADFVKIYDLSVDVLSPQYYFLLPSGKVRDCSFWFRQDGSQFTFFISSSGYIYWQPLCPESSARHGPFYVTNILDVSHPEIKESNGQTGGGGVSVYYSHCLQLLCFSYAQGKTFMASVSEDSRRELQLGPLHAIHVPLKGGPGSGSSSGGNSGTGTSLKLATATTSSGSTSTSSAGPQQPLCQWAEVPGHPGLLLCLTQSSYTPIIIMVEPKRIMVEEIKVVPSKVKVTDMVALRHLVSTGPDKTENRTTLILLCDDGSLRIFMASAEMTSFWLSPTLQPPILLSPQLKMVRKESLTAKASGASTPTFPTDFFENCSPMNDVEFGGNDLLHVYNSAQLKHRLNTSGLYVACTKQSGFSVEINNPDMLSVIVGVRILVGTQDVQRAPACVDVFGRNIPFAMQRHRWFDIPLTKEESLQADKKLVLTFGPSNDPLGVTMLDSIKVYGKTKESFGWPDDADEQLASTGSLNPPQQPLLPQSPTFHHPGSGKMVIQSPAQITLDQLVSKAISLIDSSLSIVTPGVQTFSAATQDQVLQLSTQILTLNWSAGSCVPGTVKQLLSSIYPSKTAYHDYKDRVLLTAVLEDLKAIQDESSNIFLDPEAFYNVLSITKSVATSQPGNLIKFTSRTDGCTDFLAELLAVGRRLHRERARNPLLSPVGQLGMAQIDFAVQSLVEILFSFALTEPQRWMPQVMDHYLGLLLCDDASVSHAAKSALQRAMKSTCCNKPMHPAAPVAPSAECDKISGDEDDIMRLAIAMSLEQGAPATATPRLGESSEEQGSPDGFRQLRLALLQRITNDLPELKKKGGLKSIHFLQVLLILVSELRPSDPVEQSELLRALSKSVCELNLEREAAQEVAGQRTPQHEVQLLIMKFFGFLLSTHKSRAHHQSRRNPTALSSVASVAAKVLLDAGLMERCLVLLQAILQHWKANGGDETPVVAGLLKHPTTPIAFDLSPFFSRLAHRNVGYVFEGFSQLLTEMALRLPYLVKKVNPSVQLDKQWIECLCQYVSAPTPSAVKRHVRKLLLFQCGSKEKYRQVRDILTLETHFKDVKKLAIEHGLDSALQNNHDGLVLPYDELVTVMEHLKVCLDVAATRTANWQLFCQQHEGTLSFLIQLACFIDEGVCSPLLQLLRYAFCPLKNQGSSTSPPGSASTAPPGYSASGAALAKKAESFDQASDTWDLDSSCTGSEGCICGKFVQILHSTVERRLISRLVFRFLLDCNVGAVRWHVHALVHSIYRHSNVAQQQELVALMWSLWSGLQLYGRKAAQFVDLLGYFTIKTPGLESSLPIYVDRAVLLLKEENQLIVRHPNAVLYNGLAGLVNLDGYYLERDPCLACSALEVPFTGVKLTTLKADVRFTTTTQIIKLIGSHVVNRFALRISDIKRTKMVRTINIFYNNRPVQAAVELKNRPGVWLKAKKLSLTPGQTEVKVDLPLPITCCNLKIEFAAFYENLHASSEMLQCPRCSASVPAHPGVCSNCGENVYQCHKCRSINYDEKDPFLCNACGFCKYAKFELTLSAKPCCTVEPVESEDDRKKSLNAINGFLEKADRLQGQLSYTRESLEVLISKLGENFANGEVTSAVDDGVIVSSGAVIGSGGPSPASTAAPPSSATPGSSQVNRVIQQISQRYHSECKSTFEELSKIAQRVAACRREIVTYDAGQRQKAVKRSGQHVGGASAAETNVQFVPLPTGVICCYGCACAALDHCLTLLRAMATKPFLRRLMFEQGLLQELLHFNIAQGSAQSRNEVRDLLCLLTLNNSDAVDCLNQKLMESVDGVLKRSGHSLALLNSVRHEMALLAVSLQCQDSCWEKRLRSVVQLFLKSTQHLESPAVMDVITLPCLKVIQELIQGTSESASTSQAKDSKPGHVEVLIDLKRWLQGDPQQSFDAWKSRVLFRYDAPVAGKQPGQVRQLYLMQKYGARWRDKTQQRQQQHLRPVGHSGSNWLQAMLFNPNSRLSRQTACVFLEGLARVPQRRQEVVNLLTSYLFQLGSAGPYGLEFFSLYMSLVRKDHWRYYLVCRGLLPKLADLIQDEINSLTRQEMAGRSSELSHGHAMKSLVELLSYFLEESSVRQAYKGRLVGHVLNGYLNLRRLVLQRTRLVDETQDLLLQLLGDMTTGTEAETKQFMSVCVQTLRQCLSDDLVTPVFVVERLCSIIHPEEKDDVEFLMSLDKDPQQEDFLQGRMQGNPYSSNEPGLGPLMRDIKNKICTDCELIALLEDDTGMELLVCNKIMSLDLPVRDVYRKVFLVENNEAEPMRIVYRMRGLLGDATEEFIERFDDKHQRPANDEETYRMANVMGECGGLDVILERLSCVCDIQGEGRPLLGALVKLLAFCVKVLTNRVLLITPELNAVQRLLVALKLCLKAQPNMPPFTEQLLEVMEAILCQASDQSVENYARFSSTFGTKEDLDFLLQLSAQMAGSKTTTSILTHLTRVIPFLTFVNDAKMDALIEHFRESLDFSQYDTEHSQEQATKLELFCALTSGIEHNAIGNTLKDRLVASKVVQNALEYLHQNAPVIRSAVARDSPEWKEFVAKPSLKFVLRLLTGLAHSHVTTQEALAVNSIPLFHHLEQISSDEHVGSLAENLLEAMRGHPEVAAKIEEVRQQTKQEKKRLAMAKRESQLKALGMKVDAQGQVKAENPILQQLVDMGLCEEPGPVCVICREGYRFQPGRVLAIYTFSRRCQLEDLEAQLWYGTPAVSSSLSATSGSSRPRKTLGYYTCSHFNVVHVECHLAAVRQARARDEWESAALQNANTRCNGLLPLWGPQVPESAFASCLARHNTYLQECTGHRDIGYVSTCHDLKLLLLRFALERSFSDESGGGGPQSNINFMPYLLHAALYVLNTTRSWSREEKNLKGFLETPRGEKWVENTIEAESPFYFATLALLVQSTQRWNANRLTYLGRLLVAAHCRHQQLSKPGDQRYEKKVLDYSVYKPALVFFALINGIYNIVLKNVSVGDIDSDWPGVVAEYIRHNDEAVLRAITDKLLSAYQNDFLTCGSFDEFCDVAGLLEDIPSPDEFIRDLLQGIP